MTILVSGSLAFDTTIEVDDKFRTQCCDEFGSKALDAYHIVPDLRRDFGGGAGNICYNLSLLAREAIPVATVGTDFDAYAKWLDEHRICRDCIMTMEHNYTAQNFVIRDMDDNRITAFHPGAMDFSHFNRLPRRIDSKLAVIAANGFDAMRLHAQQLSEMLVPFVFYPANSLRYMTKEDVNDLVDMAHWAFFSRREWKKTQELTGLTPEQMSARLEALIINNGTDGVDIYTQDTRYQIPPIPIKNIYDLVGAEDAFCAGLVYGLEADIDWDTTGRIASLMWLIKVGFHGTQKHHFSPVSFKQLFKRTFGYALIA
jgi:adenosine kinase